MKTAVCLFVGVMFTVSVNSFIDWALWVPKFDASHHRIDALGALITVITVAALARWGGRCGTIRRTYGGNDDC